MPKYRMSKSENESKKKIADSFMENIADRTKFTDKLKMPEKKRKREENMKDYMARRMKEMHG